jgi:hypothetical protein
MTGPYANAELERWQSALQSGDQERISTVARQLAESASAVSTDFRFYLCDKLWVQQGDLTGWVMQGSGTDPRNITPTARLSLKSDCPFVDNFRQTRNTMVGVIVETGGMRFPFYAKTHNEHYEDGVWTHNLELKGIWDILNYLIIWPSWFLPIQVQPISHAVFIWALCTVLENMVAECALRIQSGLFQFVNNALSLNPDIRTWFGGLLRAFQAAGGGPNALLTMLKTPIYVKRTNPFLDTSPLVGRTVRMESCGAVIGDITRAYGVDTRMDLWLPGDPQPDQWAHLAQPTYVFSTADRSQIRGPFNNVLDSALRTIIDLQGSLLGRTLDPLINPRGQNPALPEGAYEANALGVKFVSPYAIIVAPEPGEDSSIISCDINHHTPEGWQHIIGGRSPKWLNDLMNATFAWVIDSISIVLGFTGIPSDLLAGFLNNAFFAFQLIQHYERRNEVGPYHPGVETFTPTSSAPYNIETLFAFLNKLWDTKGYTSAMVKFRNGEQYTLGNDIFKGGLMSLVFGGRRYMLTDYIENVMWSVDGNKREVLVQLGDGKRDESPLAKHQRLLTAAFEAYSVLTLAPQS